MPQARTIDDVAAEIVKLQLKRKKLEAQVKELEEQEKSKKDELFLLAEKLNLSFGGNKKFSWKITPKTVPQVADWDAFYKFIYDNKYFHLLQRRPAVLSVQELWGQNNNKFVVPGVEKFTKNDVSVKEL